MGFVKSNESLKVDFELSGMTMAQYKADKEKAEWSDSCPETANYNLETEQTEHKRICKKGVEKNTTTKTLTLTLEGGFDDEVGADVFLHQNFLEYERGLVRITDYASNREYPQIYVGVFDRNTLEFPATGGEDRTYSYEGSSGDYEDETIKAQ